MNSALLKVYGLCASIAIIAFLVSGHLAKAQETPERLDPRTQERAINLAANITNRMEAILNRYVDITRRMESNMEKQIGAERDVSTIEASVESLQLLFADTTSRLGAIDQNVNSAFRAKNYYEGWQLLKPQYKEIETNLQKINDTLRQSLISLSAIEAGKDITPVTTSSSTAQVTSE